VGLTLNGAGSVLLAIDTLSNSAVAFDTTTGDYNMLTTVPTTVTTVGYPGATLSPDGTHFYYLAEDGAVQVTSLVPPDAKRAVGAPVLNTADPTTGTITGTVAAIPARTKLTYTLISPPAIGTLVFNKTTGAFTYTPTAAQRMLAGLSAETDAVDFTVTVAVAKTTVPLTITVPVPPTQVSDLGSIDTKDGADSIAVTNTRAYVTNFDDHSDTVIDTINRAVITTIDLGHAPISIAVAPDGKKDLRRRRHDQRHHRDRRDHQSIAGPIDFGENRYPLLLTVSPNCKTLYATGGLFNQKTGEWDAVVSKINTATNKVSGTVKLPGAVQSFYDLTVSPDGKKGLRHHQP
jgi:YVTN family beta-propeller protein